MLRRLDDRPTIPHGYDNGHRLRAFDVPSFRVRETVYDPAEVLPPRQHAWAMLCLTLRGGYQMDWGRVRLNCGEAALLFQAPEAVYGAHISDAGSHCLTVAIDPAVFERAADMQPGFELLNTPRRPAPHWLAFQLHLELQLRDDLSSESLAHIVFALLAELRERPGVDACGTPPLWLDRVQEQIDDELCRRHTLESLARSAGVHHVHLAREFRRRLGCTVGHYIRQRRIEFACHRLIASQEPLAEIAFDAGFADQSHFTNTFRKLVGMPPGVFRARFAMPPHRPSPRGLIRFKTGDRRRA